MFTGKTSEAIAKVPKILLVIGLVILLLASTNIPVMAKTPKASTMAWFANAFIAGDGESLLISEYVTKFVDKDGHELYRMITPVKPPKIKVASVEVPQNSVAGVLSLGNVPAFDWSYGCSATSAAMMFGYYDRAGYSNIYTGPTNGGVCPLDNSVWGSGESPISATHNGVDGRTTRGHVDDYWIAYGSAGPDPYITNGWTEHSPLDSTADFMGTSQWKYLNTDGSTRFYYNPSGAPLSDYTGSEPGDRDGCHGMRLFAESRGYTVLANYNQRIQGAGSNPALGFTFANYCSEIDAGRPVLIQLYGHTMLGDGYNTTGNLVYLHDTWDYSDHQMIWGGNYSGMAHYGVTVLQLAPSGAAGITVTSPNGGESWTVGESRAIQWSSSGVSGNVAIELSRNGGSAWETLFTGAANDGNESWTVGGAPSETCRVRVTSASAPEVNDMSDGNFAIVGIPPVNPPVLSLPSPNLDFGASDTQQTFTVQNSGGGTLSWNASESCDWITGVSPSSGSLGSGQGQNVNVTISRGGKAPGTYNATISIASNGGSQGVSVAMTVPSPDTVQLTTLPQTVGIPAHVPFSIQVQAGDSLGHTLTFALLSGPGSLDPSSGLFSWNDPQPGQSGVLIQATCSGGASDQDTLTLLVTAIPPEVQTGNVDGLSQSGAILHGEVQPHQLATWAWFQWGLSAQYGQETAHGDVGSGNSWVPMSAPLSGLLPGQLYHYRLVAQNASGLSYGVDCTFTTDSPPAPLAIESVIATPLSGISSWNPLIIQASANRSGSWSGTIHHPSGTQIGTLTGGFGSTYGAFWAPPVTQNFCGSGFYAVVQVTVDGETQTSIVTFAVENFPAKIMQVSLVNEASQPIANPKAGQAFFVVVAIQNNSTGVLSCFSPLTVGNRYIGGGAGTIQPGQLLSFFVRCGGLAAGSYPSRIYVWVSLGGYALAQPLDFTLTVVP